MTYPTAGTYTARLTVVDNTDLSSSTTKTITVTNSLSQQIEYEPRVQADRALSAEFRAALAAFAARRKS